MNLRGFDLLGLLGCGGCLRSTTYTDGVFKQVPLVIAEFREIAQGELGALDSLQDRYLKVCRLVFAQELHHLC